MKIGCCVNMLASTATKIGNENIPVFKELGYDYIELPLAQVMDLSPEDFNKMYQQIKGIPVEACNNFFPPTVRLTGEEHNLDKALEYAKRATQRAAMMGVSIIVLGSSGAKNIPEGFPYPQAKEQFITLLGKLQDIAAPLGITIVLEPLNSLESNFVLTAAEGLEIVKEVACDNIKLLVDYYHMRMENESLDILKKAGKDLMHLHIAAKEGRKFPNQTDGEDYKPFFETLKAVGYDARISVEGFSENIQQDGSQAAKLLRGYIS